MFALRDLAWTRLGKVVQWRAAAVMGSVWLNHRPINR